MAIRHIVTDIEGTTTDADFVKNILFPYAEQNMAQFLTEHVNDEDLTDALNLIHRTLAIEKGIAHPSLQEVIESLEAWMKADRKHTGLKIIQGHLWRMAYEQGLFQGHVFDDVMPAFQDWKEHDIVISVYSSGSSSAQVLLFKYSDHGDLTPFFSHYFDTSIGHKRDTESYKNIIAELACKPNEILFLSDVVEELNAACEVGIRTLLVDRSSGCEPTPKRVCNFTHIDLKQWD